MARTLAIADVIQSLGTLPGDWRLGVSVTGNLAVVAPNGQVTHSLSLETGELRPLVGSMSSALHGAGAVRT
jgi:hypothetical protein